MRVLADALLGVRDAHRAQHLHGVVPGLPPAQPLVVHDDLHHLLLDIEIGVQGGHGILENHRHFAAAHLVEFVPAHGHQVPSLEQRLARGPAVLGDQPEQGHHGLGFAGARFAHDGE